MEERPISIELKGIERNVPFNVCGDGVMDELINLRFKDGGLRPMGRFAEVLVCGDDSTGVFVHRNAGYEHWLRMRANRLEWFAERDVQGVLVEVDAVVVYECEGMERLEFVGNVVCLFTGERLVYIKWSKDGYVVLGERPELPVLKIGLLSRVVSYCSESEIDARRDTDLFRETETGYFTKCVYDLNKAGYFIDRTLIRFALRLYDGSYSYHSAIYYVEAEDFSYDFYFGDSRVSGKGFAMGFGKDGLNFRNYGKKNAETGNYVNGPQLYEFGVLGFKPVFEFSRLCLEEWKDIVTSIDVFACPSIGYHRLKGDAGKERYEVSREEVIEELEQMHTFYKIAEVDLNGVVKVTAEGVSGEDLVFYTVLGDDYFSHNLLTGSATFVYNSKLHVGNLRQRLFEGYNYDYLLTGSRLGHILGARVVVYIVTENGEAVVKREFGGSFPFPDLSPLLLYPDKRAYKMVIMVETERGYPNNLTVVKEFALRPHAFLNMAYYLNLEDEGGSQGVFVKAINVASWEYGRNDVDTYNMVEVRGNVLKVSKVGNPFFFDVVNTYTCGNGDIVGICTVVGDVSSGTPYGAFPLYVFCSDGIKLLETGTGEVFYTRVSEGARDVCCNGDSITAIDTGVVFVSDRGLMVTNGANSVEISGPLRGLVMETGGMAEMYEGVDPDRLPVALRGKYTDVRGGLCEGNFVELVRDACIGYCYRENELFVGVGGRVFVYGFDVGRWYKYYDGRSVMGFVVSYPEMFVLAEGNVLGIGDGGGDTGVDCLLLSRSIKCGTEDFKKVKRVFLRGDFLSNGYNRFLVYGSENGKEWMLLGGCDRYGYCKDIGMFVARLRCRYVRVCFMGNLNAGSMVTHLDAVVEGVMGNKVR